MGIDFRPILISKMSKSSLTSMTPRLTLEIKASSPEKLVA
jgi:hypothetical protein